MMATPLTRIFIEEKDTSELPFIAKNVLTGMFLGNDNRTKVLYQKAFKMIIESDNSKAIENLTTDLVAKGKQYKQYNFDKLAINLMRQMVQAQEAKNHPHKAKNIEIIKTGMAKLIN